MTPYTEDGGVIPDGMPRSYRNPNEHKLAFGLYKGVVLRTVYSEDPHSSDRGRVEYVVKIKGQEYPNAVTMQELGGVYDYKERIKKGTEISFTGKLNDGTYDENLDGEHVYVLFLEGHGNVPVIVGHATHPRRAAYKKNSNADGRYDVEEFNGVEFKIDKDSNYTITQVGRKNPSGKILNPTAVGSIIKLHGNGDIEIDTDGSGGTSNVRMKLNKATKKFEIYAQNNKLVMDAAGVKVDDKNGNTVEMKSGQVNVTVAGECNINSSGKTKVQTGADCEVEASGKCKVTASTIELNGSTGQVLTTMTDPVIDLITGVPTMGVPTVKAG